MFLLICDITSKVILFLILSFGSQKNREYQISPDKPYFVVDDEIRKEVNFALMKNNVIGQESFR